MKNCMSSYVGKIPMLNLILWLVGISGIYLNGGDGSMEKIQFCG